MKASEYLREAAKRIMEEAERVEESEVYNIPAMPNIVEAVAELKEIVGVKKTHHASIRVEIAVYDSGKIKAEWGAYGQIGYDKGYATDDKPTLREALDDLRAHFNPPPEAKPEEVLAEVAAVLDTAERPF